MLDILSIACCGSRKIRKGVVLTANFSVFVFSHPGRTDLPREARGPIDSRGVRTSISKETWARGYKN